VSDTQTAEASADQMQAVLTERALDIRDRAVGAFVNEYGYTLEDALNQVAGQALYRVLLFGNLLPPEIQQQIANLPLIQFPEPDPSFEQLPLPIDGE
jgi:hypothetical protein